MVFFRTWQGARRYTEEFGSKVLEAKQYIEMSAKHARGSMRLTRSRRDVASRVVSLEPGSDCRGFTQFGVPQRGTRAANRGTASYDSQSNVRMCPRPSLPGIDHIVEAKR